MDFSLLYAENPAFSCVNLHSHRMSEVLLPTSRVSATASMSVSSPSTFPTHLPDPVIGYDLAR